MRGANPALRCKLGACFGSTRAEAHVSEAATKANCIVARIGMVVQRLNEILVLCSMKRIFFWLKFPRHLPFEKKKLGKKIFQPTLHQTKG